MNQINRYFPVRKRHPSPVQTGAACWSNVWLPNLFRQHNEVWRRQASGPFNHLGKHWLPGFFFWSHGSPAQSDWSFGSYSNVGQGSPCRSAFHQSRFLSFWRRLWASSPEAAAPQPVILRGLYSCFPGRGWPWASCLLSVSFHVEWRKIHCGKSVLCNVVSDKIFKIVLYKSFIQPYNVIRHSFCLLGILIMVT